MKQFWQMMLSFTIQELVPITILGLLPSTLLWCYCPAPGRIVFVVETGAVLLNAFSFVVIGRFLRRQWTEASPYVYKSGFSLLAKRSYSGIEETDSTAFSKLLDAVRHREAMAPLRPWLLTNDITWYVLLAAYMFMLIPMVIVVLVMKAISRLMNRTLKMHGAHGR